MFPPVNDMALAIKKDAGKGSLAMQLTPLLFTKEGYRSDTLTVKISPQDTIPITLLLRKGP